MKIREKQKSKFKFTYSKSCEFILIIFLCIIYGFNELRVPAEICLLIFIGIYNIANKNIKIYRYTIWNFMFITICILSYIYSYNREQSLVEIRVLLQCAIIGNCIISFIDTKEKLLRLYRYICIAGGALIIRLIKTFPVDQWGQDRLGDNSMGLNPNSIGIYLAFAIICSAYIAIIEKKRKYYIVIIIFSYVIFMTGSRKAIIIMVLGICILIYSNGNKSYNKITNILMCIVGIYICYKLIMNIPTLYNLVGVRIQSNIDMILYGTSADGSTMLRKSMIEKAKYLFQKKPILGYGVGSYNVVSGVGIYSHNNFYELLVGVGLIGFTMYYSMYIYMLIKLLNQRQKIYIIPLISILITLLISEYGLVSYNVIVVQTFISIIFSGIHIAINDKDTI